MSFKVKADKEYGRYIIDIGTGKSYRAKNLQEVVFALQHYYSEDIPMYPSKFHTQIKHSNEGNCCPLCENK